MEIEQIFKNTVTPRVLYILEEIKVRLQCLYRYNCIQNFIHTNKDTKLS